MTVTTLAPLALSNTVSWGIVLLSVVLGLTIALRPVKRDSKVEKAKN